MPRMRYDDVLGSTATLRDDVPGPRLSVKDVDSLTYASSDNGKRQPPKGNRNPVEGILLGLLEFSYIDLSIP